MRGRRADVGNEEGKEVLMEGKEEREEGLLEGNEEGKEVLMKGKRREEEARKEHTRDTTSRQEGITKKQIKNHKESEKRGRKEVT